LILDKIKLSNINAQNCRSIKINLYINELILKYFVSDEIKAIE